MPFPLYLQHLDQPYRLRMLTASRAVYLKYNQCLSNDGFQRLAARALALLRAHPAYRLIVDLRNNPGGDSGPFQALINGIQADPAMNRPGRVIALINDLTFSSATLDSCTRSRTRNAATRRPHPVTGRSPDPDYSNFEEPEIHLLLTEARSIGDIAFLRCQVHKFTRC